MRRHIKFAALKLWTLTLALLIVAGVLIGLVRLALPQVSKWQEDIENLASASVGMPVRIGKLRAGLSGIAPSLVLQDVIIKDKADGSEVLHLSEARLALNVLASLRDSQLRLSRIVLVGGEYRLLRDEEGRISLAGFPAPSNTAQSPAVLPLLGDGLFELRESRLSWEDRLGRAGVVRLEQVEALLHNRPWSHRADVRGVLAGEIPSELKLAVDLSGSLEVPSTLEGKLYAKGDRLPLDLVPSKWLPSTLSGVSGLLRTELWGEVQKGHLAAVQGDVRLFGLAVQQADERPLDIQSAAGRVDWGMVGDGWLLRLQELHLATTGGSWPASGVAVQWNRGENDAFELRAGADFIRIQDVLGWLPAVPVDQSTLKPLLDQLAPRGEVRDLRLSLSGTAEAAPSWTLQAKVDHWHSSAWRKVPAIDNLGFSVRADEHGGSAKVESDGLTLRFASLFRDALELQRVQGALRWEVAEDGSARIATDDLLAENADLKTLSRLQLWLPSKDADEGVTPFIDAQTDFNDGNAEATSRYLPVGIMPPKLVEWLDRSVVAGKVPAGSFLLFGPLRSFPFNQDEGRFEVVFGVEQGVLDYREQWPRLEELNAELSFINNRLEIHADKAKLLGSDVLSAEARIDQLHPISPLKVSGVVEGPLQDGFSILRDTPLSDRFGTLVQAMQGVGPSRTRLSFELPLRQRGEVSVKGEVDLHKAALRMDEWDLAITDMQGTLGFSNNGLSGKGIRGYALGSSGRFDVSSVESSAGPVTRIVAKVSPSMATLARRFPGLGLESLEGRAPWEVQVEVGRATSPSDITPVSLRLDTTLQGVELPVPAPLGKTAEQEVPLRLSSPLTGPDLRTLEVSYGDQLKATLQLNFAPGKALELERGEVRVGGQTPSLPDAKGLHILGTQQKLALVPWVQWIVDISEAAPRGRPSLVQSVDLDVAELDVRGFSVEGVNVSAAPKGDHWDIAVRAKDLLEGTLTVPAPLKGRALDVNLKHLQFKLADSAAAKDAPARGPVAELDPQDMPAVRLHVDEVLVNGQSLGSLDAEGEVAGPAFALKRVALSGPLVQIEGQGQWAGLGKDQLTRLTLEGTSADMGKLTEAMGFGSGVKGASMLVKADLQWPGAPSSFGWANLGGDMDLNIGKGRLLDIDPGMGRVFGLLSFGALRRRLSLDFSDFFLKGFAFDKIVGKFHLQRGDAHTDGLKIEGPSARITISGRTGLAARDYDQQVDVVPRVSASLPVAGVLAGGPAVGAVLLLAQQLFGKEVDKIGRIRYQVSGSWDDPQFETLVVEPAKASDDSSTDSGKKGLTYDDMVN